MGITACFLSLNEALADEVAQLDNAHIVTELDHLTRFYEQSLAQGHDILISIY